MSLAEIDALDRVTAYRSAQTQNSVSWGPGPPDWDRIGGVVRMLSHGRGPDSEQFAVALPVRKPAACPMFSSFDEAWQYLECWRICHGMNPDGSER